MKANQNKPQVYSKHLVGKATQERLSKYDSFLKETLSCGDGKSGALEDIIVLEVSEANFAAITAATMLGEYGAEVIKLEPPAGDSARKITPNGVNVDGIGIPFITENRNKRFVKLDINDPLERENFMKLGKKADVLIDAVRPGLLDELGIGYRQLLPENPGLIYTAISPYGHFLSKGKDFQNIPDTDITAQAASGYPALIGDPFAPEPYNAPVKAGLWAAWSTCAVMAVSSIMTAVLHRRKTGEGQFIDVATNDVICNWQTAQIGWGFNFGRPRDRVGKFDWAVYPFGFYETKDGFVTLIAATDADFRGILKILKRWDLEDDWRHVLDRITDNISQLKVLDDEICKEMKKFSSKDIVKKINDYSASAAKDKLRAKGMPMAVEIKIPIDVLKEKHWQIRESFTEIECNNGKKIKTGAPVPKMSASPPVIKWYKCDLGQDNEMIYQKFGLKQV